MSTAKNHLVRSTALLIVVSLLLSTGLGWGAPPKGKSKQKRPSEEARALVDTLRETENLALAINTHLAPARTKCKSAAVSRAARQQMIDQSLSGDLSAEKFAELLMYAPFFEPKDQAWTLEYLQTNQPAFHREVLEYLSGYEVALHLYGSIVAGSDAISAAGRNLTLKTELIAQFLKANLESMKELGQEDTEVFRKSLQMKLEIEKLAHDYRSQPSVTSPKELSERYQTLKTQWENYSILDAGQAQLRLEKIDRIQTTAQAVGFVKQASQLTLTVGAGILSGGLASGTVSSAFGAIDQITEDAILSGDVDWSRVGRRVVIDAATGAISGGTAGLVGKVGTQSAKAVLATGASETVANLTGKGIAVVVGHEVDSVVTAAGAGVEYAWQESAEGRDVNLAEAQTVLADTFKQQHSVQAIAVGAGAAGLRSTLVRLPPSSKVRASSQQTPSKTELPSHRELPTAISRHFQTRLIANSERWMPLDPQHGVPAMESLIRQKKNDRKYLEHLSRYSLDVAAQTEAMDLSAGQAKRWKDSLERSPPSEPLQTQRIIVQGGGQVQSVYSVLTRDGRQTYFRPLSGRNDQTSSTRNTLVAAQLNEMMGLDTVPRAKVVKVNLPNGEESMGVLSESAPGGLGGLISRERYIQSASFSDARAFEFLIGNSDVHGSNFHVDLPASSSPKVQVFDHGPAFPVGIPMWSAGHPIGGVLPDSYTPRFIESARNLNERTLKKKFGDSLTSEQIESILLRRDLILSDYDLRGKPTLQ